MKLNALAVKNAADILSQINLFGDSSIVSTNSSTSFSKDFNALLTEMTGTAADLHAFALEVNPQTAVSVNPFPTPSVAGEPASVAEIPLNTRSTVGAVYDRAPYSDTAKNAPAQTAPATENRLVENQPAAAVPPKLTLLAGLPLATAPVETQVSGSDAVPEVSDRSSVQLSGQKTAKPQLPENLPTSTKTISPQNSPLPLFAVLSATSVAAVADKNPAKVDEQPVAPLPVSQVTHPELERAFADVKKFEVTVQPEFPTVSVAGGEQRTAVRPDQPSKQAIVTTDTVANVLQQQLPPRVVPVLKVVAEQKPSDRSKLNTGRTADVASPSPVSDTNDLVRPAERIDQPPATHPIEIPNLPHLPVIRTVVMQVGETGSEVTVRIQQRSNGEVTLQLNAGSDKLQQNLQSSVASLAEALKLENVSVSSIEVSRKSPADKVRRMKETH